jgi:hypothetical protein
VSKYNSVRDYCQRMVVLIPCSLSDLIYWLRRFVKPYGSEKINDTPCPDVMLCLSARLVLPVSRKASKI